MRLNAAIACAMVCSVVAVPMAQAQRAAQPLPAEVRRARQVVALYLRRGLRQPYTGTQVTRLLPEGGRVRESTQIVMHAGPGRERLEYTSPPAMRGEVLLVVGGRLFHYRPRRNAIQEGVAPVEQLLRNVRDLAQAVRQGRIGVRVVGTEEVAGQRASIVEIRAVRGGAFYRRFWIDDRTGVRLKGEMVDPSGRVVSTSYFQSIDYAPVFDLRQFRPDSLPNVPHEALLPKSAPLETVQAAQQRVAYPVREPVLPSGFRLDGAWVVQGAAGRQATILRYTDGVNSFTLFQMPAPTRVSAGVPRRVAWRRGAAHWAGQDRLYTLIGGLRPQTVQRIVDSLP